MHRKLVNVKIAQMSDHSKKTSPTSGETTGRLRFSENTTCVRGTNALPSLERQGSCATCQQCCPIAQMITAISQYQGSISIKTNFIAKTVDVISNAVINMYKKKNQAPDTFIHCKCYPPKYETIRRFSLDESTDGRSI